MEKELGKNPAIRFHLPCRGGGFVNSTKGQVLWAEGGGGAKILGKEFPGKDRGANSVCCFEE